jgi:hypothetical protein
MAIFPRVITTSTADSSENASTEAREMSLSVLLATDLFIFAVVRGIFRNNHSIRAITSFIIITSGNIRDAPPSCDTKPPHDPPYSIRRRHWSTLTEFNDGAFKYDITQQSNGGGGIYERRKVSSSFSCYLFDLRMTYIICFFSFPIGEERHAEKQRGKRRRRDGGTVADNAAACKAAG